MRIKSWSRQKPSKNVVSCWKMASLRTSPLSWCGNLPRIFEWRSSASVGALIERPTGKGTKFVFLSAKRCHFTWIYAGIRWGFPQGSALLSRNDRIIGLFNSWLALSIVNSSKPLNDHLVAFCGRDWMVCLPAAVSQRWICFLSEPVPFP